MNNLKHAEREALAMMADKPLEIWTESMESACAVLVCDEMSKRGLCVHERANATLARFTITDKGRRALAQ